MAFGNKTTAEEVAASFPDRISGKYFLFTGANIGLGKETTRVLAKYGGMEAKGQILKESPNAEITVLPLDVANLESINHFVDSYLQTGQKLDVLINNGLSSF
jgi:NAD(P)-dependent dehydrogenase (short-subunit alcohol dehydrogenase family)